MYNRLDSIPACDIQTDRRTDRQISCHGIVRAMHTRRAVKTLSVKFGDEAEASFFDHFEECAFTRLIWQEAWCMAVPTFLDQITALSKSCCYHIRELRRRYLDFKTASTIATSIVHSKLDYCNSIITFQLST